MRSPVKEGMGALELPSGINITAIAAVTSPTTGPARNTHVVVVLKTEPFRKSLKRS